MKLLDHLAKGFAQKFSQVIELVRTVPDQVLLYLMYCFCVGFGYLEVIQSCQRQHFVVVYQKVFQYLAHIVVK